MKATHKLKRALPAKTLSTRGIARRSHTPAYAVVRILRGDTIDRASAEKFCRALDLNFVDFFE